MTYLLQQRPGGLCGQRPWDLVKEGTDAGVFRWNRTGPNAWDGTWQCFSSGLPACTVKDLGLLSKKARDKPALSEGTEK